MKTPRLRPVTLLVLMLAAQAVPAAAYQPQDPAESPAVRQVVVMTELLLRDGSRLYGTVVRETDEEIAFRTQAGVEMTVRRADILRLRQVKGILERGEFWRADPNRTRLFFAPTGQSLDPGQVSLGFYYMVMPFVQVGVTDRFSVGGGTPLFFGIEDWERPFWLTPKLQVYRGDRTQVAIGTLHILDTGGDDHSGIAYAVGTTHGRHGSFTVGLGRTYTGFDGGGGVLMIGGDAQVSRGIKLMTENYVWKGGDGFLSGGIRFFGERLSADVALLVPIGMGDLVAFPMVNFAYFFSGR